MNKKQILIVDDKEQIAKILYAYLQADYDCHYVQNPLHAIKRLLAGHMPDLIICLLEEGAEDYIVKPFNPQELKIRIKKILD